MAELRPPNSLFRRLFGLRPPQETLPEPVMALIALILEEAINAGAQRVQISVPSSPVGIVRWYVQEDWHEVMRMPGTTSARVVDRLKALGNSELKGAASEHATVTAPIKNRVMHFPTLLLTHPDGTAEVLLELPVAR